jgi:hypothetical protein
MRMGSGFPQGCRKRSRLEKQVLSVLFKGKNMKNSPVLREMKGPFLWPRHRHKVGMNTMTPATHLGDEESDMAHQVLCRHGPALFVLITFHLNICTPMASCIYGHLKDPIICYICGIVKGGIACHIHGHVKGAIYGIVSCTIDRPITRTHFIPTFFTQSIACGTG